MTVTVLGESALSVELPQVTAAFGTVMANVQAEVDALAAFSVTPPSIEADLVVEAQVAAGLELNLTLGVTPPSLDAQLAIVLAALAELQIQLGLLNALAGTLTASVHLYRYDGQVDDLGNELQTELSGGLPGGSGSDVCFALLFAATAPAAITAMQALFKSNP